MTKKLTVYISLALLLIIFAFPLSACTQNKTTSSVDTKSTSQPKTKEVWVMTKSENRSLTYVYYDQQFDRSGNMISQKRSPRMKDGVEVTTYNYSYRDDGTLESSTENTHQKEGNKDYERYWSYDEHGNATSNIRIISGKIRSSPTPIPMMKMEISQNKSLPFRAIPEKQPHPKKQPPTHTTHKVS